MSQHDRYISPSLPVILPTRCSTSSRMTTSSAPGAACGWRWPGRDGAGPDQYHPRMVAELEAHVDDINYEVAIAREKLVRMM